MLPATAFFPPGFATEQVPRVPLLYDTEGQWR